MVIVMVVVVEAAVVVEVAVIIAPIMSPFMTCLYQMISVVVPLSASAAVVRRTSRVTFLLVFVVN